jgi:hypothetical protein
MEPTAPRRDNAFAGVFGKVQPGMLEPDVVLLLGVPDKRRVEVLPDTTVHGPHAALAGKWPTETPFDEWEYRRADEVYLVWFSNPASGSNRQGRVLARVSHPKNELF